MSFKDFSTGVKAYSKGLKLIAELKLWKYFFIPALIGLLVGGVILTGAYLGSDNIGNWLSGFWPWDFGKSTVEYVSQFLGGLLIVAVGLILYKHIIMALSAPFMAPISEKIEVHLTGKPLDETDTFPEYMRSLARGVKLNIRNLIVELLLTLLLMIIGIIPGVGIITTILIFYVQSYYAGYGNMDYTLERHLDYNLTKKFVRKNRGLAVGNGFVFNTMLFIPLVGIMITLPISTAAATVETVTRIEENKKKQLSKK